MCCVLFCLGFFLVIVYKTLCRPKHKQNFHLPFTITETGVLGTRCRSSSSSPAQQGANPKLKEHVRGSSATLLTFAPIRTREQIWPITSEDIVALKFFVYQETTCWKPLAFMKQMISILKLKHFTVLTQTLGAINLPDLMWRTGADGRAPEKSLRVLEEVEWCSVGGAHPSIQDQGTGGGLYCWILSVVASIGHSETFDSCPKLWGNVSAHC